MQKLVISLLLTSVLFLPKTLLAAPGSKEAKASLAPSEITIDAVVATVDEKPILLSELGRRLNPPRSLTIEQAANNPEVKQALDALVFERLIEEEAAFRKVGVSDSELEEYMSEVAKRNNMDKDAFEKALRAEGKTLADYKRQVRQDILKTKLMSSSVRGGISVTDEEIEQYIKENAESNSNSRIKLRQIMVRLDRHSEDEAKGILDKVVDELEDGDSFESLASKYSEGAEAKEGGLLGVVDEKDLSSEIFDAVFSLSPGEVSRIVKTDMGLHIFFVDEKVDPTDDSDETKDKLREEARKALMERKGQEKASAYFSTDLVKNHSVDKKI